MKTILDQYQELYLERLCEEENLYCRVVPLKLNKQQLVPNYKLRYSVEFKNVGDYFVLQEVIEAALGNKYLDDNHLTQCIDSRLAEILQINEILGDDVKHFVLRTAHCIVHVFTSESPEISEIQG
ncbi:MAG TPA: hypothetical protein VF599_19560 [Pyrinomonadaceae bacterium]|jgi:hypothetical protein